MTEEGSSISYDNPHAIEFKPDGTKMYIIQMMLLVLLEFQLNSLTLTTPWDTSTISWSAKRYMK